MSDKAKRSLRTVSKIVLIISVLILIVFAGYSVYMSLQAKPKDVYITNVTDSSFTISWITDSERNGVVYYGRDNKFLPGFLGGLGRDTAHDDRDVSYAQTECVKEFNDGLEVGEDFTVSGSNFDCSDVRVSSKNSYYTHHITVTDLDPETVYSFRIGDGFWSWEVENYNAVKTYSTLDEVRTPDPLFGRVITEEGYVINNDGVVYFVFNDHGIDSSESVLVSSVVNDEGGWYFDSSVIRDVDGNLLDLENSQDTFEVMANFMSGGVSDWNEWVFGYFNGEYPDIVIKNPTKNTEIESASMGLVGEVEAKVVEDELGKVTINPFSEGRDSNETPLRGVSVYSDYKEQQAQAERIGDILKSGGGCNGGRGCGSNASCLNGSCVATASYRDDLTTPVQSNDDGENPVDTDSYNGDIAPLNPDTSSGSQGEGSVTQPSNPERVSDFPKENLPSESFDDICASRNRGSDSIDKDKQIDFCTLNEGGVSDWADHCGSGNTVKAFGYCDDKRVSVEEIQMFTCKDLEPKDLEICVNSLVNVIKGKNATQTTNEAFRTLELSDETASSIFLNLEKTSGENFNYIASTSFVEEEEETSNYTNLSYGYDPKEEENCIQSGYEKTKIGGKYYCVLKASETGQACPSDTFGNIPYFYQDGRCYDYSSEAYDVLTCDMKEGTYYNGKCYTESQYCEKVLGNEWIRNSCEEALSKIELRCESYGGTYNNNIGSCEGIDCSQHPGVLNMDGDLCRINIPDNNNLWADEEEACKKNDDYVVYSKVFTSKCIKANVVDGEFKYYCYESIGGVKKCISTSEMNTKINYSELEEPELISSSGVVKGVSASNIATDSYYLPEVGLYSFQLDGEEISIEKSDGNVEVRFYVDSNDIAGLQFDEDTIISADAYNITYEKISDLTQIEIKEGINLISISGMPVDREKGSFTAKDLFYESFDSDLLIEYVAKFEAGRWEEGYHCNEELECTGNDFEILPGEGYLVMASEDGLLNIPTYGFTTPVPVSLVPGWNLVGIHGHTQAFTARTFIDSVNTITGLTADNVTWWPTSKGKYEGIQVVDGQTYGLDYPIDPENGYFVRISQFEPEDTNCKSMIWNYGGDLNGTCGIR